MKSEKLKTKNFGIFRVASFYARVALFFSLFTIHCSLFTAASAQDDEPAPPPLKIVTKEERVKLDGEPDVKARTKLAVELIKLRIDEAEKLNVSDDFDGVFREFGHFRGLLDYTVAFLEPQDTKQNRTLDSYKRLDLCLRAVTPRIEAIRREIPLRYEDYVRELLIYVRDARRKVSESMLSDTVIPNGGKSE